MSINFSAGDDAPVDVLALTEETLARAAEDLTRLIRRISAGNFDEAKATPGQVNNINRALEVVVIGRNYAHQRCKQVTGAVGAVAIDFHAARDEVGRRLACLRDAGPG